MGVQEDDAVGRGPGRRGGACRSAMGNKWARMMIVLAAMQGLGKPGSNIWSTTQGAPWTKTSSSRDTPKAAFPAIVDNTAAGFAFVNRMFPDGGATRTPRQRRGQLFSRLRIPEAILDGHSEWRGKGFCG